MNQAKKIWLIKIAIGIIYLVGFVGILYEETRSVFLPITPYTLLLSSLILIPFHKGSKTKKTILLFATIFLLGLIIEVIGVNTGLIFGEYHYGKTLGIQIFDTPIIIGLNWLLLIYTSLALVSNSKLKEFTILITASLLMVFYDYFVEAVAHKLDMWHWHAQNVPTQNYIAWFMIAFVFHLILKTGKVKVTNPLASTIFLSQLVFFILLTLFM